MPKTIPAKSTPNYGLSSSLSEVKTRLFRTLETAQLWVHHNWFRLLMIALLIFILLRKDIRLELDLQNAATGVSIEALRELLTADKEIEAEQTAASAAPVLNADQAEQIAYVKRFAEVARKEMSEYGIPASITLAQGLLETNAGESPLAREHNNHFGIKCFSRSCKKGHCANYSDDSHKDFFRIYDSAWESYRAHSLFLTGSDRYANLFRLPKTDYRAWAKGLSKAGYATDKRYADKLIRLIEALNLQTYDV